MESTNQNILDTVIPKKGFLRNCSQKNLSEGQMWGRTTRRMVQKFLWRIVFKFGMGDNVEYLYYSTKKGAEGYAENLGKQFKGVLFSYTVKEEEK